MLPVPFATWSPQDFNVLHYDPGQHYAQHMDTFHPAYVAGPGRGQGQRMATLIMYLTDVRKLFLISVCVLGSGGGGGGGGVRCRGQLWHVHRMDVLEQSLIILWHFKFPRHHLFRARTYRNICAG